MKRPSEMVHESLIFRGIKICLGRLIFNLATQLYAATEGGGVHSANLEKKCFSRNDFE